MPFIVNSQGEAWYVPADPHPMKSSAVGNADQSRSSAAQIRANRKNARKSTGPTGQAGKKKSSQNARKHHVFSSSIEPVKDGSMVEDPDEFYARVNLLVESMKPANPVEVELATRIAGLLIKLERNDRWGAQCINSVSVMTDEDIAAGARTEADVRHDIASVRMLADHLREPPLTEDPSYMILALAVWKHGPKPRPKIKGLWDDANVPSTPAEWRKAYKILKKHSWNNDYDALAWLRSAITKLELRLEFVEDREQRIAANRIYNGPFDLQIKYESRLLNNLKTLRKEYVELQKRNWEGRQID